jgi:hypothetical protein
MDTAIVMGNGPSVDQFKPEWLSGVLSIGTNGIGLKFREWGRPTDIIVVTDSNRIGEFGTLYKDFAGELYVGHQQYIIPPIGWIRRKIGSSAIPLRQKPRRQFDFSPLNRVPIPKQLFSIFFDKFDFNFGWEQGLNFGFSVVISSIQIAILKGCKRILLTGVDSSYPTPKSYFTGAASSIGFVNNRFVSNPRIFMEPMLVLLQIKAEELGVEIIDCTPGGKLHFIRKGAFEALL